MDTHQPITTEQLARLYRARNLANSDMVAASRVGEPGREADARETAKRLNRAYDDARRQYKREQKAVNRGRVESNG